MDGHGFFCFFCMRFFFLKIFFFHSTIFFSPDPLCIRSLFLRKLRGKKVSCWCLGHISPKKTHKTRATTFLVCFLGEICPKHQQETFFPLSFLNKSDLIHKGSGKKKSCRMKKKYFQKKKKE